MLSVLFSVIFIQFDSPSYRLSRLYHNLSLLLAISAGQYFEPSQFTSPLLASHAALTTHVCEAYGAIPPSCRAQFACGSNP
jgi:hypothetical protein